MWSVVCSKEGSFQGHVVGGSGSDPSLDPDGSRPMLIREILCYLLFKREPKRCARAIREKGWCGRIALFPAQGAALGKGFSVFSRGPRVPTASP